MFSVVGPSLSRTLLASFFSQGGLGQCEVTARRRIPSMNILGKVRGGKGGRGGRAMNVIRKR